MKKNNYRKLALEWFGRAEEEFKIHNLIKLFDYCQKTDKKFPKSLRKSCYFLNKYYVATRYPGETEEYPWDEVKKALEAANQIKNKIVQKVQLTELI